MAERLTEIHDAARWKTTERTSATHSVDL